MTLADGTCVADPLNVRDLLADSHTVEPFFTDVLDVQIDTAAADRVSCVLWC